MSSACFPDDERLAFERDMQIKRGPTPEDLFRAGQHNVVVRAYLENWRHGHCTFEQATIGMALELAKQNAQLLKMATEISLRTPASVVIQAGTGEKP